MLSIKMIRSLNFVVALSPKAEAYERRRKVNSLGKVDARGGRDASVEDFDILDRGRPSVEDFEVEVFNARDFEKSDKGRTSVEDFGSKKSKSETQIGVENFRTFRFPTKENTKRRALSSSWSSWAFSQKPNFNFPTRTRVREAKKQTNHAGRLLCGENCDLPLPRTKPQVHYSKDIIFDSPST